MATSIVKDWTTEFNAASALVLDVNGWDYVVVQVVSPTGTLSFTATNDGGAIQGSTLGNQLSAANFGTLAGQDLGATASATFITSTAASAIVRFAFPPNYIKLAGSSITVTKLIVKMHKQF